MRRLFRSLTNRIFLASALLAVASIVAAVWWIDRTVTAEAEREIDRGLAEAGALVDEYRRLSLSQLAQAAQLIADLPKFKAAVELNDPPTVGPLADDYDRKLQADLFVVTGRGGRVLAQNGVARLGLERAPAPPRELGTQQATVSFVPVADGILQLVTVPVWIDPTVPDVLGWLCVGVALDARFASQIKQFTDSDIAFAWDGTVRASTLDANWHGALGTLLAAPAKRSSTVPERSGRSVVLKDEEYDAVVRPIGDVIVPRDPASTELAATPADRGAVIVLRSRTARLHALHALHTALAVIALTAVLVATLSSYLVARTVTRPIRAVTAAMRDMASTGDLTRAPAPSTRWGDEDARLLAHTFNTMTSAIDRFQREAAQRERLSSLGRLSTVIAHEIRNPLMIIKSALRTLRRAGADDERVAAVKDIDEEVARLNRLVNDVLDFARPIKFDLAPARLSSICVDAAQAVSSDGTGPTCRLALDPAADAVITDGERLREALINLLTNAREAVGQGVASTGDGTAPLPAVDLATAAMDGDRVRITIRDRGAGIDPGALPRIFDPFFTTKATGTGIGLAITSNIIQGLGGSIRASSAVGAGTEMTVELPRRSREATLP